jgi:hypothetical protein
LNALDAVRIDGLLIREDIAPIPLSNSMSMHAASPPAMPETNGSFLTRNSLYVLFPKISLFTDQQLPRGGVDVSAVPASMSLQTTYFATAF